MNKLLVTKRNNEKVEFNAEKINKILLWACENINNVSASDVAMNAEIQFFNGITTKQIHEVLIDSAVELINEKTSNYQYVAGNLLNYLLRKEVFGVKTEMPSLEYVINKNVELGFYDKIILEKYTNNELAHLDTLIKHERDYEFTHAGIQQMIDKYLVQDRKTKQIYETPQYAYMLIAMTVFGDEVGRDRFKHVIQLYELLSQHKISLPTPIIAGVRTPNRQYSSCVLIDTNDDLDSICYTNTAITKYVARRAGIGLNTGKIRGVNSKIRGGEVVHTGVIPFLKQKQSSVHSCSQGGIRKGGATTHFPFWHQEIMEVLVLKNNKGTDDNRVRHIDYSIQCSRLFYKRFIDDKNISLFSPADVPGLYEAFGYNDKFDELYEKYEADKSIKRTVVSARELMNIIAQERIGTGRIYIMNIDHVNQNSAFKEQIVQSNLCQEITLVTKGMDSIYDIDDSDETEHLSQGEIALCVLAAHNLGKIKDNDELYLASEYMVRLLDFVIDHQDYPINAAKKMKKRRSLGIGVTNFAYWMIKNNLSYKNGEDLYKIDELFENIQYSLLLASNKLAQEKGACEWYNRTTYSDGILPIDRYNKNIDKLVSRELSCDWESLRSSIKEFGLRNSVLSAQMPVESSSILTSSTSGVDAVRDLIISKRSKSGVIKVVVPEIHKYKNRYEKAYEIRNNDSYNKVMAVIQKWYDQAISTNHFYEYDVDGISIGNVIKDILSAYKWGLKTLYYANTDDKKTDNVDMMGESASETVSISDEICEGGACSL
jgi:ribonucleoside-diphosphate reductase alpha chain